MKILNTRWILSNRCPFLTYSLRAWNHPALVLTLFHCLSYVVHWTSKRQIVDGALVSECSRLKIFLGRLFQRVDRNDHRSCSVKKDVLKNFANSTGKHLCWSLFSIKSQTCRSATLLKRYSNAGFFLWNLPNFEEHLQKTTSD